MKQYITLTKEEFKRELKDTLISLSVVNDMPIPQQLNKIKDMVAAKQWEVQAYVDIIYQTYLNVLKKDSISLRSYLDYKSVDLNSKAMDAREYHYYDSFDEQIAIAVHLHDGDFLKDLKEFYSIENKTIRLGLNIGKKTTNYGNISYSLSRNFKCDETSGVFRPFYFDWKEKWTKFLERISDMEYKNVLVLKIDFIKAYSNLDWSKLPDTNPSISLIKDLMSKYKEGTSGLKGVPYGGPLESHMAANYLILKKIEKLSYEINALPGLEVVDFVSYADDSLIVIKCKNLNKKDTYKTKLVNKLNSLAGDMLFHKPSEDKKDKTYIFDVAEEEGYDEIRNSYVSMSTIDSMFLASDLSENQFVIKGDESDTRTARKINKKNVYKKISEIIDIEEFITNNKDYIDLEGNAKFLPQSIVMLLNHFEKDCDKSVVMNSLIKLLAASKGQKQMGMTEVDFALFETRQKILMDSFLFKLLILADQWDMKDVVLYLVKYIGANKYDGKGLKETNERLKKISSTYLLGKRIYERFNQTEDCSKKSKYYKNDLNIIAFIKKNRDTLNSRRTLLNHIKLVAKYSSCEYKDININNFSKLFGATLEMETQHEQYWSYTKKSLSFIFSSIFGDNEPFIFYRYKKFLNASNNRIDFIEYMKYLSLDLEPLVDINEMPITNIDKKFFRLIQLSANGSYDNDKLIEIDKLTLIRQFTKLLWSNGSQSTQTFTSHNHSHGDTLLIKMNEIKTIGVVRNRINQRSIKILPLIASLYLHDLGMLLNVDGNRLFNGRLKDTYVEVANIVRSKHGVMSSEIVLRKVAKMLNLNHEWIAPIILSSIAHQEGVKDLKFEDKTIRNNALILSALDLFDVTFERSSILSRMITGDYVNAISKMHWQKHYLVRSLQITGTDNKLLLLFKINNNIMKQYDDDTQKTIKKLITKDIDNYLQDIIDQFKIDSIFADIFDGWLCKITFDVEYKPYDYPENHKAGFYNEKNEGFIKSTIDKILTKSK